MLSIELTPDCWLIQYGGSVVLKTDAVQLDNDDMTDLIKTVEVEMVKKLTNIIQMVRYL